MLPATAAVTQAMRSNGDREFAGPTRTNVNDYRVILIA